MKAIEALELQKEFLVRRKVFSQREKVCAVKNLSFNIERGETVAFLGGNGAGKSTTIKMLCGILTPTSGKAHILGFQAGKQEASLKTGLVFGTRSQMWMHMTLRQSLSMIGDIYYLTSEETKRRIHELADIFEIGDLLERRARSLSLGQRMRSEVMASLMHKPEILLADEPTIGLDVISKRSLRELLLRWQKEEKKTLLLTSHDMSDVEKLCQRSIVIYQGEKVFDGPLEKIYGEKSFVRRIVIRGDFEKVTPFHLEHVKMMKNEIFEQKFELDLKTKSIEDVLVKLFGHYPDRILDVQIEKPSLEEAIEGYFRHD